MYVMYVYVCLYAPFYAVVMVAIYQFVLFVFYSKCILFQRQ